MSGNKPEQEPSIEEILASIRQIISDDDGATDSARPAATIEQRDDGKYDVPLYNPNDAVTDEPSSSFKDVLELTNEIMADDETDDVSFDAPVTDIFESTPVPPAPADVSFDAIKPSPSMANPMGGQDDIDALFSAPAASATTEAFSRLLGNIPVEREENQRLYADGRITLEDIVKDLLRPMLRQWVDDNVPALVERLVEKELEKLARQAR